MKDVKNNKVTKEKVKKDVDDVLMKKLFADTVKKLGAISKELVIKDCKKTTGLKYGKKVLVDLGLRKGSFKVWIKVFNKAGNRINDETFTIKNTGAGAEKVIDGLIAQVVKNFEILKAAKMAENVKTAKPAPKKETFAEATIVEEIPIEEALKENKKKEVAAST